MTLDPTHADYKELQDGLRRAHYRASDARLFTMLRDPVERLLSEYRYVTTMFCRQNNISAWDYFIPCNLTISEFIEHPTIIAMVHNRQAKMIAGVGDEDWRVSYATADDLLKAAKDHLADMFFVLLHEEMEANMKIISACVDESFVREQNITTPARSTKKFQALTDSIEPATLQRIGELNELDALLYRFGSTLFENSYNNSLHGICSTTSTYRHPQTSPVVATLMNWEAASLESSGQQKLEPDVRFGEELSLDVLESNPDCDFPQTSSKHIGTFSWYNLQFGCAFDWNWFRTGIWKLSDGTTFETRIFGSFTTLRQGNFVLFLGAAQTMGIQSSRPFAKLVEDDLMLPSISIGWGGVGAEFYLRMLHQDTQLSRSLKILIASARVVVVQAMSGRSVSTEHCKTLCGNMYCEGGNPVSGFLNSLGSAPKADLETHIRQKWVADHIALLDEIGSQRTENKEPGLVGTLYISSHPIRTKPNDVFPQIVTATELERLERHVHTLRDGFMVHAYLEKPTTDEVPLNNTACARRCPNGISGTKKCSMEQLMSYCDCSSLHIDYYPTHALHKIAAWKLVKSITEQLPRSALRKARISLITNDSQWS